MEINLKYYGRDLIFQGVANNGYPLLVGQTSNEKIKAFRPMELLLFSLASCSSVDIVKILQKQRQNITDYHVNVEGIRQADQIPSLFENIVITFSFTGDLSFAKLKRAVDLSLKKYCSVSKIIEQTATINYKIILNQNEYES